MGGDTTVDDEGDGEIMPVTQGSPMIKAPQVKVNGPLLIVFGLGADAERIVEDLQGQCLGRDGAVHADAVLVPSVVLSEIHMYPALVLVLPDDLGDRGVTALAPFEMVLGQFRRHRRLGIESAYNDPSLWLKVGVVTLIAPRAILGLPSVLRQFKGVDVRYSSDEDSIDLFAVYSGWKGPTAGLNASPQVGALLGNAWSTLRGWGVASVEDADRLLVAINWMADEYFERTIASTRSGGRPRLRYPQLGPVDSQSNALRRVLAGLGAPAEIGSTYRKSQVDDLARAVRITLNVLGRDFPSLARPQRHKSPVVEFQQLYVALGTVIGLSQPG